MTEIDLSRAEWHRVADSSQDGNCVEVARNLPGLVAVRDSKSPRRPEPAGLSRDLASVSPGHPRLANPSSRSRLIGRLSLSEGSGARG